MPIRIRRHDKALIPTQLIEDSGIGMLFSVDSTAVIRTPNQKPASYADQPKH